MIRYKREIVLDYIRFPIIRPAIANAKRDLRMRRSELSPSTTKQPIDMDDEYLWWQAEVI